MGSTDAAVELVAYDPAWPSRFAAARAELLELLPAALVEHIGSTRVPGLSSKDTIDIALGRAGYEHVPESFADDPHHAFLFRADGERRTEHLHLMTAGRDPMDGHVLFRDFLRADPWTAARYEREKRRLAERFGDQRDEYVRLKQPVVEALMARARAWKQTGPPASHLTTS